MAVCFLAEGTEDLLFPKVDVLRRVPGVDEAVYLNGTEYKVERVATYLADDDVTNPLSGQVAPWGLSRQDYKIYLSVPA